MSERGWIRTCAAVALAVTITANVLAAPRQETAGSVDRPLRVAGASNPRAIGVAIGIQAYDRIPSVDFAIRDAESVSGVLVDTFGYRTENVLIKRDKDASLARLKQLVRGQLPALITPGQSDLFFYYSGHGAPNSKTKEGYLLPWDYEFGAEPNAETAYSIKDLFRDLAALKARSVTVMLEACFSGQYGNAGQTLVKNASALVIVNENPTLLLGNNGVVISASGAQEVASWDTQHRHGLMTYHWLEAMRGDPQAQDEQGRVTAAGLQRYLGEKVPADARRRHGREQKPEVRADRPERVLAALPVSAVRTGAATVDRAYGALKITAIEGGDLYIDTILQIALKGGDVFNQPRILAGPHEIEVRKENYETWRRTVVVEPDKAVSEIVRLNASLPNEPQRQQFYGLIMVTVDRGGTIFIDGKRIGDFSPFESYTTARIEAGPHRVRVERAGFEIDDREVVVQPNQTATLTLTLRANGLPAAQPALSKTARMVMGILKDQVLDPQLGFLTEADIANASLSREQDRPAVSIRFTQTGASKLRVLTEENIGKTMGVVVDGKVVFSAVIRSAISTDMQVTGNFSEPEAKALVQTILQGR